MSKARSTIRSEPSRKAAAFPKAEVDRLIWLMHEMESATHIRWHGEVRVTRKDWRLVRQLTLRIIERGAR